MEQRVDLETKLLSAILKEQKASLLLTYRLKPQMFALWPEVAGVIISFYEEQGKTPTVDYVQQFVPAFQPVQTEEPAETYIALFRDHLARSIAKELSLELAERLRQNQPPSKLWAIVDKYRQRIATFITRGRDTTPSELVDAVLEEYELVASKGGIIGIPSGWPQSDLRTTGWRPGDLITIVGPPYSGKTWILTHLIHTAWETGYRVLVITREMLPEQILARLMVYEAKVDWNRFVAGQLSSDEFKRLSVAAEKFRNTKTLVCSADEGVGSAMFEQKIVQAAPDIVFIDGWYLFAPRDRGAFWEGFSKLTAETKELAIKYNVPIVTTSQMNRRERAERGIDTQNLAYSYSVASDADVILGIFATRKMKIEYKRGIDFVKVRRGVPFYIHVSFFNPAYGYRMQEIFASGPGERPTDIPEKFEEASDIDPNVVL